MQQPDLTIIIPAYSEQRRIGASLDELATFLRQDSFFKRKKVETLVVVADTSDRTAQIVLSKQHLFVTTFRLLRPGPHVGKGRDVQYGVFRATGRVIVFMDADLATPLHHLERFFAACLDGSELVIGTRNLRIYRSNKARNIFSYIGNCLYQLMSGLHIEDTQCGFKMFTNDAAQLCFSKLTILGWGFDIEVLAIAKVNGLTIAPLRVDDWEDKPHSTYNENVCRITTRNICDYAKINWGRLWGKYRA
jgi:dolichyl-phosphate beta-glucosyltransferase